MQLLKEPAFYVNVNYFKIKLNNGLLKVPHVVT